MRVNPRKINVTQRKGYTPDWKNIVRIMNTQQNHKTSSENIYRHRMQPYTNTNKKICSVPLNLESQVSIDIKLDNGQVELSLN